MADPREPTLENELFIARKTSGCTGKDELFKMGIDLELETGIPIWSLNASYPECASLTEFFCNLWEPIRGVSRAVIDLSANSDEAVRGY